MSEPYGYVWTSIKDGMEIRFTRMYPNEFYKPTDITPVYKTPQRTWVGLVEGDKKTPDMGKYVFLSDDWIDGYRTGLEKGEAKLKEKNA